MAAGQSHIQALTDATRELDIGVDGGQQHSLDPGKLVSLSRWIIAIAVGSSSRIGCATSSTA